MPPDALHYTLRFEAPVGVMTGLGIAGLVDRTVVRAGDGLPYVPGSTVKGRLRFFAERALTNGSAPDPFCLHEQTGPACKTAASACTVCRLFGGRGIPSLLRVGPARLVSPWRQLFRDLRKAGGNPVVSREAEIRPGVALSRRRRTARQDHLFFDETVPAVAFEGTIRLGSGVTPEELRFLQGVGRLVSAVGSRKATGRGRLEAGVEIHLPGQEEPS